MSSDREPAAEEEGSRAQLGLMAAWAGILLSASLVLRALLIEQLNINWDEFHFLSVVYEYLRHEPLGLLQTGHAHLFTWLRFVDGNEVDQIIAGRWSMFGLTLVDAALLAWLGRRLIGGSAGVFAAFVYGACGYVLRHGASFRFDPLLTTCALAGAAALLAERRRLLWAGVAGVLLAAGVLISIKMVFFLPTFLVLALVPLDPQGSRYEAARRLATFGVTASVSGGLLFALHWLDLNVVHGAAQATVHSAANKGVTLQRLFPNRGYLLRSFIQDMPMWILVVSGLVLLVIDMRRERQGEARWRRLALLSLTLPLLTLYFYRNSFPYYYPTILWGVCLLAGCVWRRLELMAGRPIRCAALVLVCSLPPALHLATAYARNDYDDVSHQRELLQVVHALHPEPVPYIDRCGMVATFPQVGPFMTSWVMERYRRGGETIWPRLLPERQPRLLLANSPALELDQRRVPAVYRWLPGDIDTLRRNFIPHWRPIWVPGKWLSVTGGEQVEFEVLIAGSYTIESAGPVLLDGTRHPAGAVVRLEQGEHRLGTVDPGQRLVVLRWGDHLPRPARPPLQRPIFRHF